MKKFLFMLCLLFSFIAFAQTPEILQDEPNKYVEALTKVFLPALVGSIMALLTDASKHWNSVDWSWSIFIRTKIKPFLTISVIALILTLLSVLLPNELSFILTLFGHDGYTVITSLTLFGFATAIYDNLLKKKSI